MNYNRTVPLPEQRNKIIIREKGEAKYVLFEYDRTYNKEKQYTNPKRSVIGKLVDGRDDIMYPNDNYSNYFPDAPMPEKFSDASRSCCLRIGPHLVIEKVANEFNLPFLLKKHFGERSELILDLASYFIVNEENVSQYYPDYAFSHPLFTKGMRIYSDSTISRFLSSVSKEQIINFLDDWNKGKDRNQMVYVSYDSTNKNCQAGDVELVEFGKAKDEKGFPVFNLSIAFDQTNRVPLFYEEYPGSITDVSQFTHMADKVIEYGYKKIGFILDRGYFSKYNIQYMDNSGFSFLLMVKGCKALVSKLVEENRNTFESKRDCSIRLYKVYGTTVKSKLYDDDSKERYFHVYFSAEKQAFEREQLEIKLEEFEQFLKNHIGKDTKFGQTYKQFFDLSYDNQGKLRKVEERADEIQKALNLCGYFCLVSSEEMSAKEAIILYKGRDATEKLFAIDKTFLGSKSMRVHSSQAVSAKIFIEFIALIIRNRIYILLNEELSKLTKKPNYMNVPAALKELEKIEMVRGSKDLYQLSYAVSKRQKTILNAFDIDADKVRLKAAQINKKLQKKF